MKYIGIVLLTTAVFSLGAMEKDGQQTAQEKLFKQALKLAKTCRELEAQSGNDIPAELPRTYFQAFGRQPFARVVPKPSCIFCYKLGLSREHLDALPEDHIDKYAVVREFKKGTVLFVNQMPYADGNCLVMPSRHVSQLWKLSREQREEHHAIVDCAVPIFMKIFNTPGFNVGVNDGEWGGASVPDHVHTHLIPRGRDGFNRTVANTTVRTLTVKDVYDRLKDPMARLEVALQDGQETSDIDIDHIIAPDDEK